MKHRALRKQVRQLKRKLYPSAKWEPVDLWVEAVLLHDKLPDDYESDYKSHVPIDQDAILHEMKVECRRRNREGIPNEIR